MDEPRAGDENNEKMKELISNRYSDGGSSNDD